MFLLSNLWRYYSRNHFFVKFILACGGYLLKLFSQHFWCAECLTVYSVLLEVHPLLMILCNCPTAHEMYEDKKWLLKNAPMHSNQQLAAPLKHFGNKHLLLKFSPSIYQYRIQEHIKGLFTQIKVGNGEAVHYNNYEIVS